jgi:hypothetical protein
MQREVAAEGSFSFLSEANLPMIMNNLYNPANRST